ncbi:MAG: imidazolonepropionase [Desulfobacterales bacterium]
MGEHSEFDIATTPFDTLCVDCHLVTLAGDLPLGIVMNGALAVHEERIVWVGPAAALPSQAQDHARWVHYLNGAWITPGLIDCHTHLVYAGSRAREFELRLGGAGYEEIARAGGGILSTVQQVREASEEELYRQSAPRLKALMAEGVTTVEIKSGYGLDTSSELKMLRVIRSLAQDFDVTVYPTFLGAHALPPEYSQQAERYIDRVVEEMLPAVAQERLASAVDVFCERIAFSAAQTERVFVAAVKHGLEIRLHAEQLSDQKGAILAAKYDALSVDHLEYLQADGIAALAQKETVAVLLPGAFYFLRETQKPPVARLRQAGVPLAIATDCNPGSSPCTSPLLMMNMACVLFGLTPAEALAGFTLQAAKALAMEDARGSLVVGKQADLAVWDITEPAELAYRMGENPCCWTMQAGRIVSADLIKRPVYKPKPH